MEDGRDEAGGDGAGFRILWISISFCSVWRCLLLVYCGGGVCVCAIDGCDSGCSILILDWANGGEWRTGGGGGGKRTVPDATTSVAVVAREDGGSKVLREQECRHKY